MTRLRKVWINLDAFTLNLLGTGNNDYERLDIMSRHYNLPAIRFLQDSGLKPGMIEECIWKWNESWNDRGVWKNQGEESPHVAGDPSRSLL